jgi:hypothetical protein
MRSMEREYGAFIESERTCTLRRRRLPRPCLGSHLVLVNSLSRLGRCSLPLAAYTVENSSGQRPRVCFEGVGSIGLSQRIRGGTKTRAGHWACRRDEGATERDPWTGMRLFFVDAKVTAVDATKGSEQLSTMGLGVRPSQPTGYDGVRVARATQSPCFDGHQPIRIL